MWIVLRGSEVISEPVSGPVAGGYSGSILDAGFNLQA